MTKLTPRFFRRFLRRTRSLPEDRRGVASIDFAMALLPFLMLLLGIVDVARFMWLQNTLEMASEVATHYVFAHSSETVSALKSEVPGQLKAAATGLDQSLINVTVTDSMLNSTTLLTINATYPFVSIGLVGFGSFNVTTKAIAPVE
ncbi:MAG: TadE/TadG family type IV pilus assembly protein [Rhodospirillaceae bacterium]